MSELFDCTSEFVIRELKTPVEIEMRNNGDSPDQPPDGSKNASSSNPPGGKEPSGQDPLNGAGPHGRNPTDEEDDGEKVEIERILSPQEKRIERTRSNLAWAFYLLLAFIVLFSAVETAIGKWEVVQDMVMMILPCITGLTGAVTTYYFRQ
jgi:hypothetical protein